ncbi:toll/interleukin-1 receptor domain-containing protein [Bradyrhizobium sp. AUGA SZCCT0283]|uniref:toll/interleukin-1 receptor domain-containing protein n=1 Tax=Bradyrhizobium sp. AUGA SZCCT0283 TaxID=2807671 RepID=UPI001BA90FE5|nr:toll/interleukin-1 receptor domain-containing protein [Bradyrhizobium sp. AUGA SZCCT0283]MBR1279330.1 TIR domain-containing protein [Bradyrhizobium sp. AUGA SZCCT0283]
MSDKIFINYRREDSIGTAGRLRDRLAEAFGEENLFMDVDNIPAGVDFAADLNSQVAACRVFLAVIGPNWLDAKDESGVRRLDNPDDFVTIEIAAALARDIRVIPVLVDNARMPRADKLPEAIRPLVRRNAVELRNTQFRRDAETLVARMREALVPRGREALGEKAAKPGRWRVGAIAGVAAVAALLLIGWGGYAFIQKIVTTVERTVQQQREAELKAEQDRRARAVVEEEKRKAQAEVQQLATRKAEEERTAKAAAEAEAKRKADEAEEQRLAVLKAEQDRQARAAQDAEAKRKAEAERIDAAKAQQEMQARAAAEAEARFAQQRPISLGCQAAHAAVDRLRYEMAPGTSDGVKAIQVRAYGIQVVIQDVSVRHVDDAQFVSHLIALQNLLIASNAATAPIRLENDSKPLALVLVTYGSGERPFGSSVPPSLCIEGLR